MKFWDIIMIIINYCNNNYRWGVKADLIPVITGVTVTVSK